MAGDTGRGVESNCALEIACRNVCRIFLHRVGRFFLLPFVFRGAGPRPRPVVASYYRGRVLRCLNTSNWVGRCGNLSFPSFRNRAGRYTGASDAKWFVWEFFWGVSMLLIRRLSLSIVSQSGSGSGGLSCPRGFQTREGTAFL